MSLCVERTSATRLLSSHGSEMGIVRVPALILLFLLTLTPSLFPSHSLDKVNCIYILILGMVNLLDACEGEFEGLVWLVSV